MYFVEFHHHLHQNGLPTSGGGKTVRAGPHPSHCHGRQATATAGQVRGHIHSHTLGCTSIFTVIIIPAQNDHVFFFFRYTGVLFLIDTWIKLSTDTASVLFIWGWAYPFLVGLWFRFALSSPSLMHLLIPTLYHMKYPADTSKIVFPFNLTERPKTVQLLLEFMLDVLLMPYG